MPTSNCLYIYLHLKFILPNDFKVQILKLLHPMENMKLILNLYYNIFYVIA